MGASWILDNSAILLQRPNPGQWASGALRLYLTESPRICQFFPVQARHLILFVMVIAASIPAGTVETGSREDRPNIVLILADDLGYETLGAYMDKLVGRIVSNLDRLSLRRQTLVLFYADNGTHRTISSQLGNRTIQGGKGKTTDAGTRVPMIASWPGTIPAGVVSEDLIDSVDIFPTLAELAGIRLPSRPLIDGVSFADRLLGGNGDSRDWIFVPFEPRPGWDKDKYLQLTFVRDRKYKLYGNGEFYDVESDVLEANPVQMSQRTGEQRRIAEKFRSVMDRLDSPWQKSSRHSTVPASRRTALRFGRATTRVAPTCTRIVPCPAGAGTVSVLAGLSPRAVEDRKE